MRILPSACQALIPFQMGTDPRHQLGRIKRLGYIVIRPKSQSAYHIHSFRSCGYHQNRNIYLVPDLTADRIAVKSGKHQIQKNQVIIFFLEHLDDFSAVVYDIRLISVTFQIILFQPGNLFIILHDQYLCHF